MNLECHRCKKVITDVAERELYPRRISGRRRSDGSVEFDLARVKSYHKKCVPPAAFHKLRLSAENTDGCRSARVRVGMSSTDFSVTYSFTARVEIETS